MGLISSQNGFRGQLPVFGLFLRTRGTDDGETGIVNTDLDVYEYTASGGKVSVASGRRTLTEVDATEAPGHYVLELTGHNIDEPDYQHVFIITPDDPVSQDFVDVIITLDTPPMDWNDFYERFTDLEDRLDTFLNRYGV